MLPNFVFKETDGYEFSDTLTLPPFNGTAGTVYYFRLTVTLTNKPISTNEEVCAHIF
jgi:hypothetical protein